MESSPAVAPLTPAGLCTVTSSSRSNLGCALLLVSWACHLRWWSAEVHDCSRLCVAVVTQFDTQRTLPWHV
jgi:hypothetical protein